MNNDVIYVIVTRCVDIYVGGKAWHSMWLVSYLEVRRVQTGHGEGRGEVVDLLAELGNVGPVGTVDVLDEIGEFTRSRGFSLAISGDLNTPVDEIGDLFKVLFIHTPCGKGRCTDPDPSRNHRGFITGNTVLVKRDMDGVHDVLYLSSIDTLRF